MSWKRFFVPLVLVMMLPGVHAEDGSGGEGPLEDQDCDPITITYGQPRVSVDPLLGFIYVDIIDCIETVTQSTTQDAKEAVDYVWEALPW